MTLSPRFTRLWQLAATLLVVIYMLLIGGSFDATLRFRVQLLNAAAAGALAFGWLALRLKQRARLRATGLEGPLILFIGSQWLAALLSPQVRLTLEAAANITAWAIAFLILYDVLASGWRREFVVNALLLAAFIITAQALQEVAQWFALWARLGQWPPVAFRLTGLLGHANLTAAVLNLLLPLVITGIILTPRVASRLALGGLALGMLAAEFFSSSRAGWIAGAATLGVMMGLLLWEMRARIGPWVTRWRGWPRSVRLGLALLPIGPAIGILWLLARQAQHPTHGSLFSSRQPFWGPAWALFKSSPLTGAGPDLYPWLWPQFASVPPNEVVPHAHSLIMQLLSGNGVIGLGAALGLFIAGGLKLWGRWANHRDRVLIAAFISSLAGAVVHHFFDYFFDAPSFVFFFVVVSALALAPESTLPITTPSRRYHPALVAGPLMLVFGMAAFSLRGAALNEQGLRLASEGQWAEAGQAFQRAAAADPGLTLYWEEAAQAYTRAGDIPAALPLWERAAQADPYWSLLLATRAVLADDPAAMGPALDLAPGSYLFALNEGVMLESAGGAASAREAYRRALALSPYEVWEALFWSQTPFRAEVLAQWLAETPPDLSPLGQGQAALKAGRLDQAIELFEQARAADPSSNKTYAGLARAYWALGDEPEAEYYLRTGANLPIARIWEQIDLKILEGDWAAAHGDRAGAITAYTTVFSALNDYTSLGPGTYGYPRRSWIVFHREALPSDIVPQFIRADITPDSDARFAQLARWYLEDGQLETACYILERVYQEAPLSESGRLRGEMCP
jgi:O-antigen ligase